MEVKLGGLPRREEMKTAEGSGVFEKEIGQGLSKTNSDL